MMIVFTQAEIDELKQQVDKQGEGYLHYANALIERLFERKYGWDAVEYDEIRIYVPNAEIKSYGIVRPFKIAQSDSSFETLSFDIYSHYPDIQAKHYGVKYYISLFGKVGYFVVAFDSLEDLKDFSHWRELEIDYWRIEKNRNGITVSGGGD